MSAAELMAGPAIPLSSLPDVPIVPPAVRKDILAGKDINLAALLLPLKERKYFRSERQEIRVGDEMIPLIQQKDKRLAKNLAMDQFIQAFTTYKQVICESFPNRRDELDKYLSLMIEMAGVFTFFYFL